MRKNPLLRLRELGQSPWCDNIRRGLIETELKSMVRAGEITGLTSNPTIFEKAIAESTDYDDAFEGLVREGKSGAEIFDSLAVDDIQRVADLLRPIYDESGGSDGFVSLEVSPKLADQTEASYSEARRLFDLIGRPNAMIKIPGTAAGLSAIEKAIADGININVTLLFSIAGYERVAQAYLSGLEQRVSLGQPVDNLASVASFFVSRVDTAVDRLLEERIEKGATELTSLLGKAAVANARLAYQSFKKIFAEPRFQKLAAMGARVQRPLWGSTSTKNPRYSDVMYVEELIGPNTVNTMPPATIEAFRDHGRVALTLEQDVERAQDTFRQLGDGGIDLADVTRQLQAEGVAAFSASFDELMTAVERKRAALAGQDGARVGSR